MKFAIHLRSLAIFGAIAISSYACSPKNGDDTHGEHESKAEDVANTLPIPDFKDVDAVVKSQLSGMLTGYFTLNQALIEDSLAGSRVAAADLLETKKKFEMTKLTGEQMDFYFVQASKLNDGLVAISGSDDIEKARVGLAKVSEAMYALVKAFHPNETTLYYQYCPMARNNEGANWLSATKELVNPYMGQMMLECGMTKETLE